MTNHQRRKAKAMSSINFGTGEESATVTAGQLEPGVRVSGEYFDSNPHGLIVQEVTPDAKGKVQIVAADFNNGENYSKWFRADRPLTTWGRI